MIIAAVLAVISATWGQYSILIFPTVQSRQSVGRFVIISKMPGSFRRSILEVFLEAGISASESG